MSFHALIHLSNPILSYPIINCPILPSHIPYYAISPYDILHRTILMYPRLFQPSQVVDQAALSLNAGPHLFQSVKKVI